MSGYGSVRVLALVVCSFAAFTHAFNIDLKDIVRLRGMMDRGSYFGYSVEIAVTRSAGKRWILVGAPRSNDPAMPNVTRPGAVFACTPPLQGNSNCTKLEIDSETGGEVFSFGERKVKVRHGRNDSWLGGSLGVHTSASSDTFATCAHKWYNFLPKLGESYVMGLCYEIPLNFNMTNVKKLSPLATGGNRTIRLEKSNKTVWNIAYAGMGLSVHYTKDGNNLLFGAAGLTDWIGGFFYLEGDDVKVMQNNIKTRAVIRPYIGYASTSGAYFHDEQTYFVFGAPRDEMRGKVLFFRAGEAQHILQNPAKILEGSIDSQALPANAYYGATLCTMDINNDKRDDLLVAAPLYTPFTNNVFTQEIEIGIVFVYLGSTELMGFQSSPQTLKGTQPYGRFGSAIANLGDMNSDNFADIAVGAPYEDELKGAVYIYNGYASGVWPTFSQRILASSLDAGLRGFGISISSGKDINTDNINDMVAGSYLSDEAVVMFGQPVISVHAQMHVIDYTGNKTNFIEIDDNNDSVIVCFHYVDQRCSSVRLNLTISLDIERGEQTRIVFAQSNAAFVTNVLQIVSNNLTCTVPAKILTKSTSDLDSEIVIQTDYAIENISCPGLSVSATINRFNGSNPGDPLLQLREKLLFKKDCPDNICNTDLTLQVEAKYENISDFYVIGSQDLMVDIRVTKTGDASYGTVLYLVYPNYLGYKNIEKIQGEIDVSCTPLDNEDNDTAVTYSQKESVLMCMFGNPFANKTGVHFQLLFRVPATFDDGDSSMVLQIHMDTQSEELDPSDNNQTLVINIRHYLEANFTAISKTEQIYLEENKLNYDMENIFELHNRGPTLLQSAILAVTFPQIQASGKPLLFLNKTEIHCSQKCKANCLLKHKHTSPVIYEYFNGQLVYQTGKPEKTLPDLQNTDCREQTCSLFTCALSNIQAEKSVVLHLHFILNSGIETMVQPRKALNLYSVASVQINKTNLISNQTEFFQQVRTSVRKRVTVKEELPWWIYPSSVLGGIMLLTLVIVVMWKLGFFKRKKHEELEKRKSRHIDTGNNVNSEKKRDSFYEGGTIDN